MIDKNTILFYITNKCFGNHSLSITNSVTFCSPSMIDRTEQQKNDDTQKYFINTLISDTALIRLTDKSIIRNKSQAKTWLFPESDPIQFLGTNNTWNDFFPLETNARFQLACVERMCFGVAAFYSVTKRYLFTRFVRLSGRENGLESVFESRRDFCAKS